MKDILILAAHPDDEVLGMGSTVARWVDEGKRVSCAFLTDGVGARGGDSSEIKMRNQACIKSSELLGFDILQSADFPDNKMDSVPLLDIVEYVEECISVFNPDTVFTHSSSDLNIDHRIALEAVLTAARPQPNSSIKRIMSFEIPSATGWRFDPVSNFSPNYFVPMTDASWNKKIKALQHYDAEMREFPHSRSYDAIDAQSIYRGSQLGVPRAEAFSILRWLED